jgi:hypothetical protein
MVTARVWDLPGYQRRPTLAHLGHIGDRRDRWGWFRLAPLLNYVAKPMGEDPIGRLWLRGDTPLFWVGSEERCALPSGNTAVLALAWWRFPENQAQGERTLAIWAPPGTLYHLGSISDEPFGYFNVKEILNEVPPHMRLEP